MKDHSLREIKKARTKISILQAGLDLIGENTFREVNVEDICKKAEVSKVTFFKFFPQKDDLLVYCMRIWLSQRLIDLYLHPKRGLDAIEFLFKSIAESAKVRPGLMLSLISFLSEQKMHPRMPILTETEIHLLFPEHEELVEPEVQNLGDIFYKYIEEAKQDGEIMTDKTTDDLVKILFTIFYGAYLTSHIYSSRDFMEYYRLHLDLIKCK
ncbi:TetR family transcriptional regulator [Bacillus methanolicus]|uniref:TetR/AcrR family transcriptional regulator n=1 Tax=Bacillus methanolicus TaxID=1471 RepID=UPI00237FE884|nr:TetR/AcrR family transcriptional regulator [Bacillus methanolicus]MDE3839127.1 TetR family transcriptional regulator [Bacillus methanolicus]